MKISLVVRRRAQGGCVDHANVYIQNTTKSKVLIQLYHVSYTYWDDQVIVIASEGAAFRADQSEKVGPMRVGYGTGLGHLTDTDRWWVVLSVYEGSDAGVYASELGATMTSKDSGKNLDFTVDTTQFSIKLASTTTHSTMKKRHSFGKIANVFVLMLENHSFDNIFARSGINGITVAPQGASNSYNGTDYPVTSDAPTSMPTDPGHEFFDVVEQLGGAGASFVTPNYPPVNNSGFVSNYATTTSEGNPPKEADRRMIMACFDTRSQLPTIYSLAREFAICDQWFSSMPGPTWPNRYFVHGSSSSGLDHSPDKFDMAATESLSGFSFKNGSIFDALKNHEQSFRIVMDEDGPIGGSVPQVTSLQGLLWPFAVDSLQDFTKALQGYYPATYTFIEPNYGDASSGTYRKGSSQHPKDDTARGEKLINQIYEAIRNSPLWESSMFVIVYDEHGGFYDSVEPLAATPPGDSDTTSRYCKHGFTFNQYGVRVPAVVVSPWIPARTVSKTLYDHSSIPATLEKIVGMEPLTERDKQAASLTDLLTLDAPRPDCPQMLSSPAQLSDFIQSFLPEKAAAVEREPLPESDNLLGFLAIARKTELEMADPSEHAAIHERFNSLQTRGGARVYLEEVAWRVRQVRERWREEQLRERLPQTTA